MSSLTIIEQKTQLLELEVKAFELEQRRATALSKSAFFPDNLKGDIASAVIIYDLSNRMGISVMEVAQSIYIIYNKPSFSTSYLVARLNQSGKIKGSLKTVVSEDKQSAYCYAVEEETGEKLIGMTYTMAIAKAEGLVSKKGSKWITMPELMLRKRSQSNFINEFFPEVKFGLQTTEEIIDTEVVSKNIEVNKIDLNDMLKQKPKTSNPKKSKEVDLLENIEVEVAHDAETGEVLPKDPRKNNPNLLNGINDDGTDIEIGE